MELLTAAEAPFSDPFLMEFADPEAMQDAYGGNAVPAPPTFEQALMQARLEARQTAQACAQLILPLLNCKVSSLVFVDPWHDSCVLRKLIEEAFN